MIADEASKNIGFQGENPFSAVARGGYVSEDIVSGEVFRRIQRGPFSISTAPRMWSAYDQSRARRQSDVRFDR